MKIKKEYERWLANAVADTDVAAELKAMDYVEVEDAFYRDLAFGTGGLRGVIGAGTNRMNIYTVAKASQGWSMPGSATLTCCWQLTRIVTVWVLLSRIRLGSMSC